jgi:hypothetical protein
MTFEEWLEQNHPNTYAVKDMHGVRDWITFAEQAWNAAKEDSKPIAKIVERSLYGGDVEYSIIGFDGYEVSIRSTKEKAEQWCLESGYKLK